MSSLSQLFISHAYAQDASSGGATGAMDMSTLVNYLPLLLIFAVFYFLIIRPQQRKMEDQNKMLKALQKGDNVVTNGGIYGKIIKLEGDSHIVLEIADNVQVRMLKAYISGLAVHLDEIEKPTNDNPGKK